VQYWNGSAWATVTGGSVTGNNNVWRQFTFASISTSQIRVVINAGADNAYSRAVEVEAWGHDAVSGNLHWLVSDHLGTPRLIVDKTGALANVKRHDYLPFGEELFAATGGRTTTQGYSGGDGIRQQFTQKERDNETGLDYFGARYYASPQGRFTGVDPYDINVERQETSDPDEADALFKDYVRQPQHWNHSSYALNNPLRYLDPDGMKDEEYDIVLLDKKIKVKISDEIEKTDREKIKERLNDAIAKINAGADKLTTEVKKAINSMKGIEVRTDINYSFTNVNNKTFNMMPSSILVGSLDTLTGAIIHDSFHSDQARRGLSFEGEKNLVDREKEAYSFAADVAEKIGLDKTVVEWLRNDSKVYRITPAQSPNRPAYKRPLKKRP